MFGLVSTQAPERLRNLRGLGKFRGQRGDALRESAWPAGSRCEFQGRPRISSNASKPRPSARRSFRAFSPASKIIKSTTMNSWTCSARPMPDSTSAAAPAASHGGLHGSGKDHVPAGKLARLLQEQGRQPVARRGGRLPPGRAMDQLDTLGKQLAIPVFVKLAQTDVLKNRAGESTGVCQTTAERADLRHRRPIAY